jgi:hypothetical protein
MLKAYFDDSGSDASSEVVVVGGLIGSGQQWDQFERLWREKLADPLPQVGKLALRKFGIADCRSRYGEFRGYSDGEVDAVTHDFRQIIIQSELIGIAASIDRVAWDELIIGTARVKLGSALEACFTNCIVRTAMIAAVTPDNEPLHMVFDQGFKTEKLEWIGNLYAKDPAVKEFASVEFAGVEQTPPLQGADTVATEAYWHAIAWLADRENPKVREHFKHFLAHMKAENVALGRPEIEECVRNFQ